MAKRVVNWKIDGSLVTAIVKDESKTFDVANLLPEWLMEYKEKIFTDPVLADGLVFMFKQKCSDGISAISTPEGKFAGIVETAERLLSQDEDVRMFNVKARRSSGKAADGICNAVFAQLVAGFGASKNLDVLTHPGFQNLSQIVSREYYKMKFESEKPGEKAGELLGYLAIQTTEVWQEWLDSVTPEELA